jgi:CheY-like chemotaxis protein
VTTARVLIVDDEPFNVDYLEQELEDLGYDTVSAYDGLEALDAVAEHAPDVMLLDIMMPNLDGFGVLERLKGDPITRHIPVIVISAMSDGASVVRGIELGALDYLPKPFDPVLLEARLNTALAAKRLRDLEREYMRQVDTVVEAAEAVEAQRFEPGSLDVVAARDDALGRLARVFVGMANEVHLREQRLRQQLDQLKLDRQESSRGQRAGYAAYLPMDRRHALIAGAELPRAVDGSCLFADVSGFTPLTDALAQSLGRERGAEEVTRLVDRVNEALIAEVHRRGGSVIGFSGDAVTCWFDGDDGARALAAGLAIQRAMSAFAEIPSPDGTLRTLRVKVAVASGPALRLLVGDPGQQRMEVMAGPALDRLAHVSGAVSSGEVLASAEVVDALAGGVEIIERRGDARHALVCALASEVEPRPWPPIDPAALDDEACRPWLLPAVYERLAGGGAAFLAELRPAVAMMVRFTGIDYRDAVEAEARLDRFVRWLQGVVAGYDGSLIQLSVEDKGSYLYVVFGAPAERSDASAQALSAAAALQRRPPELAFIDRLSIGVASGTMRTGSYGSPERRTYGVLGLPVIVAARLMMASDDLALCDQSVHDAGGGGFAFEPLGERSLKGIVEPMPTFRLLGEHPAGPTADGGGAPDLSPTERLVLKVASVVDGPFDAETLAALLPEAAREGLDGRLAALGDRGRLRVGDGAGGAATFTFADPDEGRSLYTTMLFSQRRRLHRLLAVRLEAEGAVGLDRLERAAYHWEAADDPAEAIARYERAGRIAAEAGDPARAERLLRRGLKLESKAAVLSTDFRARLADPDFDDSGPPPPGGGEAAGR